MAALTQPAFFCIDCGRDKLHARSRCSSCYSAWLRFGGLRPKILARDGHACPCTRTEQLIVHHRAPGSNQGTRLRTLCRHCHPRVHSTLRPRFAMPSWLRDLWREQHRGLAEQLVLAFEASQEAAPEQLFLVA